MEKIRIWSEGKTALPTVYIHSVAGDGHRVWEACRRIGCPDFNLVSVYDFDFEGAATIQRKRGAVSDGTAGQDYA